MIRKALMASTLCLVALALSEASPNASPDPSEERLVQLLRTLVSELAVKPENVSIDVSNSPEALELTLTVPKSEESRVIGVGNMTLRAIRVVLNEIMIANQKDAAATSGQPFGYENRKQLIVHAYVAP